MTLMQRAMNNDDSDYGSNSQDSFRSRDDFSSRSRESVGSRGSRRSTKKEGTIERTIKHTPMIHSKYSRPRERSADSSEEAEESYQARGRENPHNSREREQFIQNLNNQRVVVSKNCMFIDERGRLVQKDLVIKGKEVYGRPSALDNSTNDVTDRMRRSREQRRSRSRERENNSRISRQGSSGSEMVDSQYSYGASSNTFYNNSRQGSSYNAQEDWGNNQSLREFMKPVQEVPNYHKQPYQQEHHQGQAQVTLNDMFRRRGVEQSQISVQSSSSRRSLHRTERSRDKR